jgi:UPF0755 protein
MAEHKADKPKPRVRRPRKLATKRFLPLLLVGVGLVGLVGAGIGWFFLAWGNVNIQQRGYLYVPTGATFETVVDSLQARRLLDNVTTFRTVAGWLGYDRGRIRPGRYQLYQGMSNYALVKNLRIGNQVPVRIVIPVVRTPREVIRLLDKQLELDGEDLKSLLTDEAFLDSLGVTPPTVMTLFLPNTYEFYWAVRPRSLLIRMKQEYLKWWTTRRLEQAKDLGLTAAEVITLASIVQAETNQNDEKQRIAGVYLNRIRKGMRLQADPTVVFALQDFSIRRITSKHLQVDSPYNTYRNVGLPPGPINNPQAASIDAVLNAERHNYIYFAASPEMNGYHVFAATLAEHNANAKRYHRRLNELNIR